MGHQGLVQLQYGVLTNPRFLAGKTLSYFARAIRGGRQDLQNSRVILGEAKNRSIVLSEHVVFDDVNDYESMWRELHPDINVYQRDTGLIQRLKKNRKGRFVADATVESIGVGFEIGYAEILGVPSIIFCHEKARHRPTMEIYYNGQTLRPTLEELLRMEESKTPIIYFNDENVGEIAKKDIEKLFTSL